MSQPKISICIPTFNRAKSLTNCLASIAIASRKYSGEFEICVSDNGSDDKTADVIKTAKKISGY